MRTTWGKIVQNVGNIYGHDIRNKLQKKMKVFIPKPEYTENVQSKHKQRMEILNLRSARLSEARESKRVMLNQAVEYVNGPEAPINLDTLENKIDESTYKASIDQAIRLTDVKKIEHNNAWRTYRERTPRLEKQQRQSLSMVRGEMNASTYGKNEI